MWTDVSCASLIHTERPVAPLNLLHIQGHMSKFAKTIVNDGKFVESACVVAKDVYDTYDALDEVVEVVKHHGKPAEIIQALGDLGGVLGDVDKSLSEISATKKVRQKSAH